MAALEYPRNTVWYIEARPAAVNDGYAPADAASMGSAVLIELQQEIDQAGGKKEVQVTRYLLTCAHVVRAPSQQPGMLGPLYAEILCFEPGKGYMRTRTDSRKSLTADGVPLAKVSEYSPCKGVSGSVPMTPQTDWVLLKVEGDKAFKYKEVARSWTKDTVEYGEVTIIGYPGGAGREDYLETGAAWDNTRIVENLPTKNWQQNRTPKPGLLMLDGIMAAPGMSGGGVFTQEENLLAGIHRANTPAVLAREAVSIQSIRDYLWSMHRLSPVPPSRDFVPIPQPELPWKHWVGLGVILILLIGAVWAWPFQTKKRDDIVLKEEVPPPVIPADVTAQFTVYSNHNSAGNILVRLKVKGEQSQWQEERRSDELGKVSFPIPGALSKAKFKVSLPEYGAAFQATDYTLREKSFPLNVPPKPGEYQPFKISEPAEQKP
ncbi:Trypsin-like peptidase domain-containing protein [Prosthecobacter debontii]|uniref:Trypsin-like peptidase domain-containing protein n=1 Tax=Prosthecobacter debontii TaxID=48467 RepID=A0A1T4XYP1_9BACT|nr:trypsin-like peptidase domain-containing protein [Prosthecobacter debontii]SKA94674.1 Trypsin-like peptidase domain-containing protein [Prosthecobacter debontii]